MSRLPAHDDDAPEGGQTLKWVGLLLLIAGGTCMAVGMIAATRHYALLVTEADTIVADSMGRLPGKVWFLAAGIPLALIGSAITKYAYVRGSALRRR